jgi:trigger factor
VKKIPVLLILCISIAGMLIGCNNKKNDVNNETNPTPKVTNDDDTNEEDDIEGTFTPIENPVVKEDYDYNDYIKLGKYKGIEVKVEHLEVTDEDIDFTIQMDLRDNTVTLTEVTDRAVKNGDTVIMDFAGYHNGEPFEGGTAEGYELTVGSGVFIDGFE